MTRGEDKCEQMIRKDPYLCTLAGGICVLETPKGMRGISSTEVRRRIREIHRIEKELEELVPPEIRPLL